MEDNTLNFSASLNFLCSLVLQQEYERLSSFEDKEHVYLLFKYYISKKRSNYDFVQDFEKYCIKLKLRDEITVTTELLQAFATWWYNEIQKSHEYVMEKNRRKDKVYLEKRIEDFKAFDSAIYCIEFDRIIKNIPMGHHWHEIRKLIDEKFGRRAKYEKDNYVIYDKWIADNILIRGCNDHPDSYVYRIKH